jgi:soluble lytic murein transglycosylase-like protein
MQLMPATAKELGVSEPFNARQNIRGGVSYLRQMLNRYDDKIELALAAYNAGPKAVDKYKGIPPYRETQGYVKRIMKKFKEYQASTISSISLAKQ